MDPLFEAAPQRHRRRRKSVAAPAAEPLTLVAATYVSARWVTLTFDRAVVIDAINLGAFIIVDGNRQAVYVGFEVDVLSPTVIQIGVGLDGESFGTGVILNVAGDNGITDEAGIAWAGVESLVLPFGG